jgi:hypothetical protein
MMSIPINGKNVRKVKIGIPKIFIMPTP